MQNVSELRLEYVRAFVNSSVSEYIQSLAGSMRVQRYRVEEDTPYVTIVANVVDSDFQTYTTRVCLSDAEKTVRCECNCSSHSFSVCTHAAVVLLRTIASFEEVLSKETGVELAKTKRWREVFASMLQQSSAMEHGKYYIIPQITVEEQQIVLSFAKARYNKTGLSTIRTPLELETLFANTPLPYDTIALGSFFQFLPAYCTKKDPYTLLIMEPYIANILWILSEEPIIFDGNSEQQYAISKHFATLSLQTQYREDLYMELELQLLRPHYAPVVVNSENATLIKSFPYWIVYEHTLYPVAATIPFSVLNDLLQYKTVVVPDEVPEFVENIWRVLPDSFTEHAPNFMRSIEFLLQEATYAPKLLINEEGVLLTLTVENIYKTQQGEFLLEGPDPNVEISSYMYDGKRYFIHKKQDEEAELIALLEKMHFHRRSENIWFLEEQRVIPFLLGEYRELVKKYAVFGEKKLVKYKVKQQEPVVTAVAKTQDNAFSLDISVEYGDEKVSLEHVWDAWIHGKGYLRLKDGSFSHLPEQWLQYAEKALEQAGLDFSLLQKKDFSYQHIATIEDIFSRGARLQTNDVWQSIRNALHDLKQIELIEPPKGLKATLRGYQLFGVSYFAFLSRYGLSGILADEMGLGKTIQTLAFLQHEIETKQEKKPNLVIVPTSVLYNWQREAEKFLPHTKISIIYGNNRELILEELANVDIIFTTYVLVRRDLDVLSQLEYNVVVLDEAQHIKNPNAITTQAVCELHSRMRICLSGTPIENNLFELWSLFEFIMPNFLGNRTVFQKNIVKPIRNGDTSVLEDFKKKVKPFILRRLKSEVAQELPNKIENTFYCKLNDEQYDLYKSLAKKLKKQVLHNVEQKGIGKSQISILDALLHLRQICCHPRLLRIPNYGVHTNMPSAKFEMFKELIQDIIASNHRVLVFSQFIQMLGIMREWLTMQCIPFAYLDGTTKNRISQVDLFNNTPTIPVFLISLKAGGVGLNLTTADYVIHYDPWWNPAVENQATDRVHRIGQTKQVFVYKLICQNTVEEKILLLQQQKKGIADEVIPENSLWHNITKEDLELLFEV